MNVVVRALGQVTRCVSLQKKFFVCDDLKSMYSFFLICHLEGLPLGREVRWSNFRWNKRLLFFIFIYLLCFFFYVIFTLASPSYFQVLRRPLFSALGHSDIFARITFLYTHRGQQRKEMRCRKETNRE